MSKILYFIAGNKATSGELLEIAAITRAADVGDEIGIRSNAYGSSFSGGIEACDYVEGTIPTAYNAVDLFLETDPSPVVQADDTIAVNNSAASISVDGTAAVTDGVPSVSLDATDTIVSTGDVIESVGSGSGTTATITVAAGVISAVVLS